MKGPLMMLCSRQKLLHRCVWVPSLVLAVGLVAEPGAAAEVHGRDLIDEVWQRYRSVGTERETTEVLIVPEPRGEPYGRRDAAEMIARGGNRSIHKRAVRHVRYAANRQDRLLVRFSLPPADAGLGLLVRRNPDFSQDILWLYTPGRASPRQIPADSRTRFVGTDFLYEDIRELSGERLGRYRYAVLGAENLDGRGCEIISARPVDGASSAYTERRIWIDTERRFPLRVEYYDTRGKSKVLTNSEIVEVEPGVFRANLAEMRDLLREQATLLLITERQIRVDMADEIFTTDYLLTQGGD